ncbi:amidohydrolase family protein [Candidatus Roizmanbacteria bacterium]|nr:amidohydrolase family protein [Candidatus Roizmanbacteria bacterium]
MKDKSILIKNAGFVVTMNAKSQILKNHSLYLKGNKIVYIGKKEKRADTTVNARGMMVIPGLINCHHHMFQCQLRGDRQLQNQMIDRWINVVCRKAAKMSDREIYYSALANMAELLLYGCTTTADMPYLFPKNTLFLPALIKAAADIGIRLHLYRGSISVGKRNGSLFPDEIVETSEEIGSETESLIRKYHDASPFSLLRIGIAPCTIFTSSAEDFKLAAYLSRKYNVNMQTHLSESEFENEYSLKKNKKRPLRFLNDLGWVGERASFAHGINLNREEIERLAATKTPIVHCPVSNARAPVGETGIAPVWAMIKNRVTVAVGVDGSAGNDSSNMLEELRWTRIMQGARKESTYLDPAVVLAMGTVNGAKLLNWENGIGSLEVGKAADIAIFNLNTVEYTGANDPLTALLSCQATRADTVIVNGKIVVKDKKLVGFDEREINNMLKIKT